MSTDTSPDKAPETTQDAVADNPSEKLGEDIKTGVGEVCPIYYVPKDVVFIENMPLTVSGKVDRKVLAGLPRL